MISTKKIAGLALLTAVTGYGAFMYFRKKQNTADVPADRAPTLNPPTDALPVAFDASTAGGTYVSDRANPPDPSMFLLPTQTPDQSGMVMAEGSGLPVVSNPYFVPLNTTVSGLGHIPTLLN